MAIKRVLRMGVEKGPPFGSPQPIAEGQKDACNELGVEFHEWLTKDESDSNKVFDKIQPDLWLADIGEKVAIPDYVRKRRCLVACGVHQLPSKDFPPYWPGLATQGYIASPTDIDWINDLKPDLLFHCASQASIDYAHRGWKQLGYKVVSFPMGGNPHRFELLNPDWASRPIDVGYIGTFSAYKSVGLCAYVLPALWYSQAWIGGPGWPVQVSHKYLTTEQTNIVWNDTKIAPCVHEPNVRRQNSGELSERLYNSALAGCLVITDCRRTVRENLGETNASFFPSLSDVDEFHEFIKKALSDPNDTYIKECRNKQREIILENFTYKHRMLQLFKDLGVNETEVHS